jgi:Cu2+-containing amine oxidase
MTDTEVRSAEAEAVRAGRAGQAHPLDPASAEEYLAGRRILADAGLLTQSTRFAYYGLDEPPKDEVLAYSAGSEGPGSEGPGSEGPGSEGAGGAGTHPGAHPGARPGARPDRRLRAFLIDVVSGESADVVVSLTRHKIIARRVLDPLTDGRVPILDQDFALAEEIVHADPGWRAAMARRGLTDVTKIRACPLTAGSYGVADEQARRMVRVLAFVQAREHDLAWAHPVDGVAAYVDLIERRVFKVIDELDLPVPSQSGDYDDPAVRGPLRSTLRPIEITQPEGPSFTLDGHHLEWQGWSLRIGFDAREGLTLHQISLADQGEQRPVIYRASIPEMVVPYGDPAPSRYWQNYFDAGEYLVGKWANSLKLGCDCLGEIAYLDAIGLGAPGHQHLFSARLDMMIDGLANAVDEIDTSGLPVGPDNPHGNALVQRVTRLASESQAGRRAAPERGRLWRVVSTERANGLGQPTGFTLYPEAAPTLLAAPGSSLHNRAAFATNHLWVTRYDPAHRYPAGDFVNQHPGGAGIPEFIANDHDIDGADVVLWHTFGPAHFPRPEDWPVMPVARCGFVLKPTGFFDRNPTLDVPPPPGRHCDPGAPAAPAGGER